MSKFPLFALAPALLLATMALADDAPLPPATNKASEAWEHLARQSTSPVPPDTKGQEPSKEAVSAWMESEAKRLLGLAEEARAFTRQFPEDSDLPYALKIEEQALYAAMQLGDPAAEPQLTEVDKIRLQDSHLSVQDRLAIRMRQVQQAAQAEAANPEGALKTYLDGAHTLAREFPGRVEPYQMLLEVADGEEEARCRALLDDLIQGDAPAEVKAAARAIANRFNALGKPLQLKFTALDGREVDLSQKKGEIVLIDFWALWCAPCLKRMPKLKEAYEKLQDLHFDVIGFNLDTDKAAVEKFVKEQGLAWPEYFDGQGPKGDFVRNYGVRNLPTFWLVDRQGVLRDLHAETNLAEKVQALLDEKN